MVFSSSFPSTRPHCTATLQNLTNNLLLLLLFDLISLLSPSSLLTTTMPSSSFPHLLFSLAVTMFLHDSTHPSSDDQSEDKGKQVLSSSSSSSSSSDPTHFPSAEVDFLSHFPAKRDAPSPAASATDSKKPRTDSLSLSLSLSLNPSPETMSSSSSNTTSSHDALSFFPSDSTGTSMLVSSPDTVLRTTATESVPFMARIFNDLTPESINTLKQHLKNLMAAGDKDNDELSLLKRSVSSRSDLTTPDTLSKSHRAQLEILVAIKTGVAGYLTEKSNRIPSSNLVQIFLSAKSGFCRSCVGCDVCSHLSHTICGVKEGAIRPGPAGEMQLHCIGCGHRSEMFGFVKEVFRRCAGRWAVERLQRELDCIVSIFQLSEDSDGMELCRKAEVIRTKLGENQISQLDASNEMLGFFKCELLDDLCIQVDDLCPICLRPIP